MKKALSDYGCLPHLIRCRIREIEVIVKKMSTETGNNQITDRKITLTLLISYYGQESIIFTQRLQRTIKNLLPVIQIRVAFRKNLGLKRIFLPIQKWRDVTKKGREACNCIKFHALIAISVT